MKVAVSGARGFVGKALVSRLHVAGHEVLELIRGEASDPTAFSIGNLAAPVDVPPLPAIDAIIHLAAISTSSAATEAEREAAFHDTNVEGTLKLARAAVAAGAKQFILLSSIKAMGEQSEPGKPFGASTPPRPETAYGRSKWLAEQELASFASGKMDYTIVRPPLVYGRGAKGNVAMLAKCVDRGIPLPLAGANNRRSLIYNDNLVDFLTFCLTRPNTKGQTFTVSDDRAVSLAEIIEMIATAKGKPARNFAFPTRWLEAAARLAGRQDAYRKLFGSLEIDAGEAPRLSGWRPPFTIQSGFSRTFGEP